MREFAGNAILDNVYMAVDDELSVTGRLKKVLIQLHEWKTSCGACGVSHTKLVMPERKRCRL